MLPHTIFEQSQIADGIRLFTYSTKQFKNTSISIYWHNTLNENASSIAMIPSLLKRGCQGYEDMQRIATYMEDLYGAYFDISICKRGEHQSIEFNLNLLNDQYTLNGESLLDKGFSFLNAIMTKPVMQNGQFPEDVFTLERDNLITYLDSIYDDKSAYASRQLSELMFANEHYSRNEYGEQSVLKDLDSKTLTDFYHTQLAKSPIDIYVLGDVNQDEVATLIKQELQIPRSNIEALTIDTVHQAPEAENIVFEQQELEQGKLLMSFATPIGVDTKNYYPMSLYTAVLGGFSISKLFANVREKLSLCYYAQAGYNPYKGHIIIRCGIAAENYETARQAILHEMNDIAKGNFDDKNLAEIKKSMITRLTSSLDNPNAIIDKAHSENIANRHDSYHDIAEKINAVTKEQIVDMAKLIRPDTSFFLSSRNN